MVYSTSSRDLGNGAGRGWRSALETARGRVCDRPEAVGEMAPMRTLCPKNSLVRVDWLPLARYESKLCICWDSYPPLVIRRYRAVVVSDGAAVLTHPIRGARDASVAAGQS